MLTAPRAVPHSSPMAWHRQDLHRATGLPVFAARISSNSSVRNGAANQGSPRARQEPASSVPRSCWLLGMGGSQGVESPRDSHARGGQMAPELGYPGPGETCRQGIAASKSPRCPSGARRPRKPPTCLRPLASKGRRPVPAETAGAARTRALGPASFGQRKRTRLACRHARHPDPPRSRLATRYCPLPAARDRPLTHGV